MVVKGAARTSARKLIDPAERRRQILSAARELFSAHGFGGTPMRAIAQAAGVNEALLYRFSPSKEQLFVDAVAAPLAEAVDRTVELSLVPRPADNAAVDVRDRSKIFVRDLLDAMTDIAPLLNAVLLANPTKANAYYTELITRSLDAIADVVRTNLPLWQHERFDVDVIVRAVYGMCWFFAIDERFGRGVGKPSDQLAEELLAVLFDGMTNAPEYPTTQQARTE